MYIIMAQHLPQFQVIKIEALSIWKNLAHQCGIDVKEKILFCAESHVFTGKKVESK